jgi:N-acyl homoserine lactone hydrolase
MQERGRGVSSAAAMRLHAFESGRERVYRALLDPLDQHAGQLEAIPWSFYVIEHPQGPVMFDTGTHPDALDDLERHFGPAASDFSFSLRPGEDTVARLASLDLEPRDIRIVVLSHLHYDHVSGLSLFKHAAVFVQRSELQFARQPPVYQRDTYMSWLYAGDYDWREIGGEHDLFGDGTVRLLPTPGHTAGHQSMILKLQESPVVLLGDATYSIEKMRARRLPGLVWNPDEMVASWELLEAQERDHGARLISSHDPTDVRWAPEECYA